MADAKLSALPVGAAIGDADLWYSDQAATSVSQASTALSTYVNGKLPVATNAALGISRPDNATITVAAGVLTVVGGAGIPGAPADSYQYNDGAGGFAGSAKFIQSGGNPNVTAGNKYLYDASDFGFANRPSIFDPYNWFIGGAGNMTTTGFANFCEGPTSGASLTSGFWNMAEGEGSLTSCTSGSGNVAIGRFALHAITDGHDNVGLGAGSLTTATRGSFNLAIGTNALGAGNLGVGNDSNIAIGNAAGNALNAGASNIFIGANAAQSATSAAANVTIGSACAQALSTGQFNTIIGQSAANSVAGANYDVAIGYLAGNLMSNSFNTVIGTLAAPAYTTGQQTIIIGYSCDVPSATASGQISIGNMIYGSGCTGTGAAVSTGKIGIGVATPAVELDVVGRAKLAVYTVGGTLPAPGNAGSKAFVSNSNATLAAGLGNVVAGGGGNFVPVFDDGANWIIG